MAESKEQRLAKEIYSHIGGPGNASQDYNCMTRVRIDIRDYAQVNVDALKKVTGVMGVVEDGTTLQVVVGPGTAAKCTTIRRHPPACK